MAKKKKVEIRREAGESGRKALAKLSAKAIYYFAAMLGVVAFVLGGLQIWGLRDWAGTPYLLLVQYGLMLILFGFCWRKNNQWKKEAEQRLQGLDGEKEVAAWLSKLSIEGYHTFNDVIGDNFNIDHVLVGPSGLYCIETKTSSRPEKESVEYNGETIQIGNGPFTDAPIQQVERNAKWLVQRMKEKTGYTFPIKGAVLYPGRTVNMNNAKCWERTWVLRPNAFKTCVKNKRSGLSLTPVEIRTIFRELEYLTEIGSESES